MDIKQAKFMLIPNSFNVAEKISGKKKIGRKRSEFGVFGVLYFFLNFLPINFFGTLVEPIKRI
jgi:hypothetical protein